MFLILYFIIIDSSTSSENFVVSNNSKNLNKLADKWKYNI